MRSDAFGSRTALFIPLLGPSHPRPSMYQSPMPPAEDIPRYLRERGITPTNQRVRLARAIFARPQHFSADQLLATANQDGQRVSKATIYNTLDLFVRKGLVRELIIDASRVFYDSTTRPHYHFYDPLTQQLVDVAPEEMRLSLPTKLPAGKEITGVEVVIHLRQKNNG